MGVKECGGAFLYASKTMQRNERIVSEVAVRDLGILKPSVWSDKSLVKCIVSRNGKALQYACMELRQEAEVVEKAVQNDAWALQVAAEKLQKDESLRSIAARDKTWSDHDQSPLKLKTEQGCSSLSERMQEKRKK